MANEVLLKTGVQFLFADHATDFGAAPATAANSLIIGTPTDVQLDLTGVAASGGARHSAKADLTTPWAGAWSCDACLEFETAPADNGVVEFFWAQSPNSTAGTGNPGGVTGSDAAYTDTQGTLGQFQRIGALSVRNNVISIGHVGVFVPVFQYGSLVVVNRASTALRSTATAMDETHIVITEIIDEIQ
jgi:hypothetical protein